MREQHEPDEDRREQRSARDERQGESCCGQPRGLVQADVAPMADRERRNQQDQREENRNEDREPDRLGEEHAARMLSRSFACGQGDGSRWAVRGGVIEAHPRHGGVRRARGGEESTRGSVLVA